MESISNISENANRSSQIIRNVLMNWAAFATVLVTGFLLSPFLIRHLGDSVYGVWVLVGSLVGYLGLLDFGILPYTTKYVAEYRARGDQAAINRVATQGIAAFSLMGIATLVLSFASALLFNDLFKTHLSEATAFVVVAMVGFNLAVSFPATGVVGIVHG